MVLRNVLNIQKEFLDRFSLAKMLASLLPAPARVAICASLEGFKKAPLFKGEMEKPAAFDTRARLGQILPGEKKIMPSANWGFAKNAFLRSLNPKKDKKGPKSGQFGKRKTPQQKRGQPKNKGPNQGQGSTSNKRQKTEDLANKACFFCHKPGHIAKNCELRKKKEK